VSVSSRGRTSATLEPKQCGSIDLEVSPSGATFELSTDDGDVIARGRVPMSHPAVLPEGRYRLLVSKPACPEYRDTVRVESGIAHKEPPIKLLCN